MVTNFNQTPVYSYRPRKTQTSDGACSTRNEKPRINIIEKNTKIIVIALELCGLHIHVVWVCLVCSYLLRLKDVVHSSFEFSNSNRYKAQFHEKIKKYQ